MIPINLNADMGESFGRYTIGNDDAVLDVVQSANVACGMHGGDPTVLVETVLAAKAKGVTVGAHPGFNDIWGFGRRQIKMSVKDLENLVLYQIAAIDGVARAHGVEVSHVKPHGALNNMAAEDRTYADAIARTIHAYNPKLIFVAIALSELIPAGERLGLTIAAEGFADRTYGDNGMLTPRSEPDAMVRDGKQAAENVFRMVEEQAIFTTTGRKIPSPIHTVCIHGDEPTAVAVGQAVRREIEASGRFKLTALPDMPLAA